MGVKDQDLSGDLPNEKALGICWNLREDISSFKLKLDAGALTKRVMLSTVSSVYVPLGFAAPFIFEEGFYKDFAIKTYKGTVNSAVL